MPYPINPMLDEDENYKKMLMDQLNAPPPAQDPNAGNNQLIASLAGSFNKLGTVGGRTADNSDIQRYADVLDKTRAMRDQSNQGQAAKRQNVLFQLAQLKDKGIQNQNQMQQSLAMNQQKQDFDTKRDAENFERQKYLQGQKIEGAKDIFMAKNEAKPEKPSVAQQSVDRNFGKNYDDFVAQGGYAEAAKSIKQVKDVADQLKNDESLTGAFVGRVPDAIREYTNPNAIDVRQKLEDVVQRSLRTIMGAQFTENEGKALISRAYNPSLPAKTNAERVERLAESLEKMAQAKLNAAKYYEANGTLNGFKGTEVNSIDQIAADLDNVKPSGSNDVYAAEKPKNAPAQSGPKPGDVEDGMQFTGGDPGDPKNWIEVK